MKITQFLILASAIIIFVLVINLVRLRRLREEYSWLWLLAAFSYLAMALLPELSQIISGFLGITNQITAFVFISILFIVSILINYSVKLSKMNAQIKDLAQHLAILDGELNQIDHIIDGREDISVPAEEHPSLPGVPVKE